MKMKLTQAVYYVVFWLITLSTICFSENFNDYISNEDWIKENLNPRMSRWQSGNIEELLTWTDNVLENYPNLLKLHILKGHILFYRLTDLENAIYHYSRVKNDADLLKNFDEYISFEKEIDNLQYQANRALNQIEYGYGDLRFKIRGKQIPKFCYIRNMKVFIAWDEQVINAAEDHQRLRFNTLVETLTSGRMKFMFADFDSVDVIRLLAEVHEATQQKEIQVYMNDDTVQDELRSFGWTGEIVETSGTQDYLMVAHTNIQGQKSDAKIRQSISHKSEIKKDGSIINTVEIDREHSGDPGERFYGSSNISYVRVYVPEGAEIIEAGGFTYPPEDAFKVPEDWYEEDISLKSWQEDVGVDIKSGTQITKEFGKTVFGNWVVTPAGESSKIYFTYRLPFKIPVRELGSTNLAKWQAYLAPQIKKQTSRYSLVIQKQSGTESNFYSDIIYPEGWVPVWKSNQNIDLAANGGSYETVLQTDDIIGLVLENEIKD